MFSLFPDSRLYLWKPLKLAADFKVVSCGVILLVCHSPISREKI